MTSISPELMFVRLDGSEYDRAKSVLNKAKHPGFVGRESFFRCAVKGSVWIAVLDGVDVGVSMVDHKGQLGTLSVIVPMQGKGGIGSALMRHVKPRWVKAISEKVEWFRRQGYTPVGAPEIGAAGKMAVQLMQRNENEDAASAATTLRLVAPAPAELPRLVAPAPAELPPLIDWIPTVSPGMQPPFHLASWCSLLERAARREPLRALNAVPIRHWKTETTKHGIARALKQNPKLHVIYMTHGQLYANTRGRELRDLCSRVGVEPAKGHNTIHEWRTEEGGGVLTMSAQASALGHDVDLLVIDDPFESFEEAMKPDVRQRVDETIAFYTARLSPGGSTLLIMSRFHPEDAYGRRVSRQAQHWEEVTSAAILDEGLSTERAFAPEVRTLEQLKAIRAELKEVDPRELVWWSQFQNDPKPDGGGFFAAPRRYGELPTEPGWRDIMGIDMAYSQSRKADFFALVLLRAWGSTAYVRRVDRLKADMGVLEMAIREAWAWNGARCPVYSYVSGPEIGALAYLGDHGLQVNMLRARYNKLVRAQKTRDRWNTGGILVPQGPEFDGFLGRAASFRGVDGDDDDEVDALVSAHDGGLWSGQSPGAVVMGRRRV